jgi:hypothetical protein
VPVAQAGAATEAPAADEGADEAAEVLAEVAEVVAGALVVGLAVLFLLVPHAAAANNAPAVSRVAAMREVLTG